MLRKFRRQPREKKTNVLNSSIGKVKLNGFVLSIILVGLFLKREKRPTAIVYSLTADQIYSNSSPEQIIRFLKEERFGFLANFEKPLIEVRSLKAMFFYNPSFTFDIPTYILCKVLNRRDYLRIVKEIKEKIRSQEKSAHSTFKKFKETTFDPIVYSLFFAHGEHTIDLVTTQTSMYKVPVAFKYASSQKRIMAWYSTNSKPIYAANDSLRLRIRIDAFNEFIDEHWVWNEDEINFLKSNGVENVVAVGPIIFNDKLIGKGDPEKFVITYFDVTPIQGNEGFYSEVNTISVLNGILKLCDVLNEKYPNRLVLQLKPKRKYYNFHSKNYVSSIKKHSKMKKIELIEPTANLYQIISKSDLVLAIPFTSPALVAKEMCIKRYFVSIGIEGWDIPLTSSGVDVVFQLEELIAKVQTEIQRKFNHETS
jgi:hypothetical protein